MENTKLIAIAEDEEFGKLTLWSEGSHADDYNEHIVGVTYHVSFYESEWNESNIDNESHSYRRMDKAYETFKELLKRHHFKSVKLCPNFVELYEEYLDPDYDDHYIPCSTNGDYSPSNPWDAPGMSIHDFI